ncbi:hypothetical protein BED47_06165 [Gottfriedia luciferensis]|uniref:Uncharacterized protein n=1 Tax=Gottfriedia luciferensis TaxID=178774 RepID=A0ABX2ZNF6_9BACI|nr:hypothetical protein [Gottfriedia luciferensis]ODG91245.1 hypothetical protein BED47_06165 [Gottfriedia luciferensis]
MKKPLGISVISYFYIFGSIVLIISSIFYNATTNSIGIADRFGVSNVSEPFFRVIVAFITLLMIFGYFRLKKWGFWFMISYSVLFGSISFYLTIQDSQQPLIGNMLFSLFILFYTMYVKKSFFQTKQY